MRAALLELRNMQGAGGVVGARVGSTPMIGLLLSA